MIKIPAHIEALQGYKPGKAVLDVFEGKNFERTAILSSNENNLGTSPKAVAAMQAAAAQSYLYPDPGSAALRKRLSEKLQVNPENIMVGNGSDSLLSLVFKSMLEQEDEVISSVATFVAVDVYGKLYQVPHKKIPHRGYAFDLEEMAAQIGPKTKMVYLANPNNPTGAMVTREQLEAFMPKVPPHVLVVIDEAYFEYAQTLSEQYPDSLDYRWDNVITLRTFSKAYGLAGLRIGYAIGAPYLMAALQKARPVFEPTALAQTAALAALDDADFLQKSMEINQAGLRQYYRAFEVMKLDFIKSYGNFVMVDMGDAAQADAVFAGLMDRGVFVRPLKGFGLPHCLRISVGLPEECGLLVEKLGEVVGKL